ncbi:MAG: P-loop containing nucleoside triphosphate hydrolase [Lasallia pustulata]|uniref:Signal recognition particle receptor subunit alpha homolog n=1 Tax=Lasallia pustulata TaxID=136370 RepID=A0A5M8PYU2_9LECA|nr:MAG: P-loop containing nucleoside triphosphate hydrolase [Lasallia pustulata]
MLDSFEILTTSGVVLWSRSYAPVSASVVNGLIKDVFIEEKVLPGASVTDDTSAARNPAYKKDQYTLKWTSVKDLGLIFVAVYQSLLHLSWIDKLVDNIRTIFVDLYKDQLKKPHTSVVDCDFDAYFDQQLKELEGSIARSAVKAHETVPDDLTPPSSSGTGPDEAPPPLPGLLKAQPSHSTATSIDATPTSTPDTSRPSTPLAANHLLSGKSGPKGSTSRRARKAVTSSANTSGDEERRKPKPTKGASKRMRKWNAEGMADEDDETPLDYSVTSPGDDSGADPDYMSRGGAVEAINPESFGTRTGKGQFLLKDLDDEVHSILQAANAKKAKGTSATSGVVGSGLGAISGLFRNIVGGKVLTKEDLEKPMKGMEEHLLKKNVAREAAVRLCEGVERELIGVKTGSFESTETTIRTAMESSLRKILTPTTSLDLLRSIAAVTSPSTLNPLAPKRRPYVISIVGVNGVGKSTNLSKLAFFLLQNNLKLLIAACDTFRSGAVEQLRVHARNLQELAARQAGAAQVELYEKGYGKDAASIAKAAVAHAAAHAFDVVLIDTAGRRHNDARLMASLEKFAASARPDKILMVGEALVGSDSVAQARSFNASFGPGRGLDGFIISKCDTVGDMVGALVSMVHATGIPVVFLGVGQHYGDLRTLNVGSVVALLMG